MYLRHTIAVAFFGEAETTIRCLGLLRETLDFSTCEVIVYNDGSPNEAGRAVQSWIESQNRLRPVNPMWPRFRLLDQGENRGFIAAMLGCLAIARGTYFTLLNNDVFIRAPNWPELLRQAFLDDPLVRVAGVQGTCASLDATGRGKPNGTHGAEYVEGSCLMIPTQFARDFGLFDQVYHFGHCEDADLSLRVRRAGYKIAHVPLPGYQHYRSTTWRKTTRDVQGFSVRNHAVLRSRWKGYFQTRSFDETLTVSRRAARGDVLLAEPIIRALHQQNPARKIIVQTDCPEVLQGSPHIYELRPWDKAHGDIRLDMAYEDRPGHHAVAAYGEAAGVTPTDYVPKIHLFEAEKQWARQAIQKPSILLHAGKTAWVGREVSADRYADVVETMTAKGYDVLAVGNAHSPQPRGTLDRRNWTLRQFMAAASQARGFVGIDSFPMHVAQAWHLPIAAVFGCVLPETRLAQLSYFRAVAREAEVGCLGCHQYQGTGRITHPTCLRDSELCMSTIEPKAITETLLKAMEERVAYLETSKIREKALPWCGDKVLDIGCKDDKIRPDATGLDDDDGPQVDVIANAAARLPFPSEHFDTVYSSHCLEDIIDTEAALTEWIRVVKRGGTIVLYLPHRDYYPNIGQPGANHEHHHDFALEDITTMLRLRDVQVEVEELDVGAPGRYSMFVVGRKR